MTKENLLEEAVYRVADRNNTMSGWTENEEVPYREFVIYAAELEELDRELEDLNEQHLFAGVEYEILEQFIDGNGDECIYLKVKE